MPSKVKRSQYLHFFVNEKIADNKIVSTEFISTATSEIRLASAISSNIIRVTLLYENFYVYGLRMVSFSRFCVTLRNLNLFDKGQKLHRFGILF